MMSTRQIIFTLAVLMYSTLYAQRQQANFIIEAVRDSISESRQQVDALNGYALERVKTEKYVAEHLSTEALTLAEQIEYTKGLADAHYVIGYASAWGPYPKAIDHLSRAYDLYIQLRDQQRQANSLLSLALVYDGMNETDKAIETVNDAIAIARSIDDKKTVSRGETNLTAIYHHIDEIDSALFHGQKALKLKREIGDESGMLLMLLNMGVILANYDAKLEDGLVYLHEARGITDEPYMINDIVTNLAYAYARKKDFKTAKIYLDSATWGNDTISNEYTERGLYQIAWELYLEQGNYQKAFEYLQKEITLDRELRGLEVKKKYEVLQLEYENEKNQNEILKLQNEQARANFRYVIAVILVIFFLIVSGLIFLLMRSRVRNAKLKEEELQLQLDHKNKELTSYALNFVQKNELISDIRSQIEDLRGKMNDSTSRELRQINRIIDESFRADKEWENFKLRFEEVHTDFFQRLTDKYPGLSNAEVKLCALIKLNMNLKEASQILGISPDSVKTARYRIRRKMDLPTDANLTGVINALYE